MISTYFSDTEAVEACICRLSVMWCNQRTHTYRSGIDVRRIPADTRTSAYSRARCSSSPCARCSSRRSCTDLDCTGASCPRHPALPVTPPTTVNIAAINLYGRNHVFKVRGPIPWSMLWRYTEQNTDGIPSFVHCSLSRNGDRTLHEKSWGDPSKFWGSGRPPPDLPVVAPLTISV